MLYSMHPSSRINDDAACHMNKGVRICAFTHDVIAQVERLFYFLSYFFSNFYLECLND
ncbi:MAG: hypothetical protein H7197_01960 [Vitreoscilla sp.]|nr:hypothetical protein [Polaromonas sp.]